MLSVAHFSLIRVRRMTLAAVVSLLAGCSDDSQLAGPLTEPPVSFAKGPFDGPKSVPTRGRIIFMSQVTGDYELYSILEDGTGLVRLTYSPASDGPAGLSPDGRKIAFASERSGAGEIWSMRPDGSGLRQITNLGAGHAPTSAPDFSPDGRSIAFSFWTDAATTSDIYIMNASGGGLRPVLTDAAFDAAPRFSPDGKRLAYISVNPGVSLTLYSIALDGSDRQEIFTCAVAQVCINHAWSPDGTRLAYDFNGNIHVLDLNTQAITLLGPGTGAAWSPDGLKLAFGFLTNGTQALATINADGSDLRVLTTFGPGSTVLANAWSR